MHTHMQEDGESDRKTYWAEFYVYVCSWTICRLSLSQLWVQTYDQNIVISLKCEESKFVVIYVKCDNESKRATVS